MSALRAFLKEYAESAGRMLVGLVHTLYWRFYPFSAERLIARDLRSGDEVCDFGCGDGQLIPRINAIRGPILKRVIGCDIYWPYLVSPNIEGCYAACVNADLRNIPFKEKSFDVALCIYMIEHLEKAPSYIAEFEKIARRSVIIITSNGYCHNPDHGIESQKHLSGYSVEDFKNAGYIVRGVGWSFFINSRYTSGRMPRYLRPVFSLGCLFFTWLVYYVPRYASCLLCIKHRA